jgi:PAT family beta-lactamase induction signal transducer AmpG
MAAGMMLPGMMAGALQEWMGYRGFFIWVMACCVVTFIVSGFLKIDRDFGKNDIRS